MSSPIADPGRPFPPGLSPEVIERRQRLQAQWRRHSILIRRLRRILPALGALVIAAIAVWTINGTIASRLGAARPNGDLAIRLLRPHFQGRDDKGRPYLLSADSAVRDDFDSARVALTAPVFDLGSVQDGQTHVHARRGIYREDTRLLELFDDVHLDDAGGMHFITPHAIVDLQTNNVDGDQHIEGNGPLGRIVASSYAVRDGGEHMFFYGHVKTHIEHHHSAAAGAPGGAKPVAAAR